MPDELLRSTSAVTVNEGSALLELRPVNPRAGADLIFICGSGIHPHAYVPLLHPIAESGHAVFIVGLPWRFAPLPSHRDDVVARVRELVAAHTQTREWVIAGHSLGGALAARVAEIGREIRAKFVLIGTTHPKERDLSHLEAPFTKIYATKDGVAPVERVMGNRGLLPAHTRWVAVEGGNHSQFGHYGHQLFDGEATISREAQQAITREVLLEHLRNGAAPQGGDR